MMTWDCRIRTQNLCKRATTTTVHNYSDPGMANSVRKRHRQERTVVQEARGLTLLGTRLSRLNTPRLNWESQTDPICCKEGPPLHGAAGAALGANFGGFGWVELRWKFHTLVFGLKILQASLLEKMKKGGTMWLESLIN